MPHLSTTLAWAVPVKVEVLGAHLEAYGQTLAVVDTLKLCNRFGKGDNAAVTNLSAELVLYIADYVIHDLELRAELQDEWMADFRCFQDDCKPEDHLDESGFIRFALSLKDDYWLRFKRLEKRGTTPESTSMEELKEYAMLQIYEHEETWQDTHKERSDRWMARVGTKTSQSGSYFTDISPLFQKHFGLNIWTSHMRLKRTDPMFSILLGSEPYSTTVAWLILPHEIGSNHSSDQGWEIFQRDWTDDSCEEEHGDGAFVSVPTKSDSADKKFKRTMKLLDLRPYPYRPGDEFPMVEGFDFWNGVDGTTWPKLTMLSRTQVELER